MSPGEAEANTSAGAPCWIWVASVPDEPKLKDDGGPGVGGPEHGGQLGERHRERRRRRHRDRPRQVRTGVVVVVDEVELPQAARVRAEMASPPMTRFGRRTVRDGAAFMLVVPP